MNYFLINILACVFCVICLNNFLHIYQAKGYANARYLKFFSKKFWLLLFAGVIVFFSNVVISNFVYFCISSCLLICANFVVNINLIHSNKTPIKYTPKLVRILVLCIVMLGLLINIKYFAALSQPILLLLPMIANWLNVYDKIKNYVYIKKAQNKLNNTKTKVIAITGSNGKTSVKNILFDMLKTKFKTQYTPASYNTPLGISKFINNELDADCELLILEFGARKPKQITALCKMFKPKFGIITTVAPQHLESFKSVENIYTAKRELAQYLDLDMCVFNLDNIYTLRMFNEKSGDKLGVSIYGNADVFAHDLKIEDYKTKFLLNLDGRTIKLYTRLLGSHNVTNIMLATAAAYKLGVGKQQIARAIKALKFSKHRLELIKSKINILDDSYNCSLLSAKQALDVLFKLPNKKMVVTPGIIEGGRFESELNCALGEMCAQADYVVIVGEHNHLAVRTGLMNAHFEESKIFFAINLEDAKQYFNLLNSGDNLLLLNDLPDDYK